MNRIVFGFEDFIKAIDNVVNEMMIACTGFSLDDIEKMPQKKKDQCWKKFDDRLNSFQLQ